MTSHTGFITERSHRRSQLSDERAPDELFRKVLDDVLRFSHDVERTDDIWKVLERASLQIRNFASDANGAAVKFYRRIYELADNEEIRIFDMNQHSRETHRIAIQPRSRTWVIREYGSMFGFAVKVQSLKTLLMTKLEDVLRTLNILRGAHYLEGEASQPSTRRLDEAVEAEPEGKAVRRRSVDFELAIS